MANNNNTYLGPTAVLDFLNPALGAYTPLVELPQSLNPFTTDRVRIMIKMMSMLPLGNIKSVPAFGMLQAAQKQGALSGITEVVEASSGNTALSLTVIARAMGIDQTTSYVSHEISPGKLKLLRLFGSSPTVYQEPICADPHDPSSRLYKARQAGKEAHVYNADQYSNPHNPASHSSVTGKQIWEQTSGSITVFASSLGTTGTLVGTSSYLKEQNGAVKVLSVIRKPNNLVPGLRTMNLLREIEHDWKSVTDEIELVGTVDSYEHSLQLIQLGFLVGPSTGFALAGLKQWLHKLKEAGTLDNYRNESGEVVCVFIANDTPFPYIDDYFSYLPSSRFPEVTNQELLVQSPTVSSSSQIDTDIDIDPLTAFDRLYPYTPEALLRVIDAGIDVQLHPKKYILDVSPAESYVEAHLYGSEHLDYDVVMSNLDVYATEFHGFELYIVCPQGRRSITLARELVARGVRAVSIAGGLMEWSNQALPRYSLQYCGAPPAST